MVNLEPAISVVIIGRNEGERLRLCIESVLSMTLGGKAVELIYVDSGSTDGSLELARKLGAFTIRLDRPPLSAARGRNAGWRAARAPFVLFLDGDTVLDSHFAATAITYFSDPTLAALGGRNRESNPTSSIYNRALDLDWISQPGYCAFVGGNALLRKTSLQSVGGYNERLSAGEEPEMCRRMRERGWRILHVDCPMTLHDLDMTKWSQYWRRALRTGYAYAEVSALFAKTADPLWKRESVGNLVRGGTWLGLPLCAAVGSWFWHSSWPLACFLTLFCSMVLKSGWIVRRRSPSFLTAAIYGIHSHVQQIPILFGQMFFWKSMVVRRGLPQLNTKSQSDKRAV